jgi:hypothetical protein
MKSRLLKQRGLKVKEKLSDFKLCSFNSKIESEKYFQLSGLDKVLGVEGKCLNNDKTVDPDYKIPYGVDISDLARIHWICLNRKTTQVLEFGSGYSTLVLAHAMSQLRSEHLSWVESNTRLKNPFKVYSIEESAEFSEITNSRLGDYKRFVDLSVRGVELVEVNWKFATLYKSLPNIFPDFIYLDGPSQYATTNSISGFSINEEFRMPMAADLLRIEYFLEPGAVILVDGRTSNATMLKNNFQRNWKHMHDRLGDFHIFELQDPFLGELNLNKFNYCSNGEWLLS